MNKEIKVKGYYLDNEENSRIESIWCTIENENYKIENIPFFLKGIAYGDIVSGMLIEEELFIDEIVEESGNSTVRIVFFDTSLIMNTREYLKKMDCDSELSHLPQLIAVNIPKHVDYFKKILPYLDKGVEEEKWDYEEGCLAHNS